MATRTDSPQVAALLCEVEKIFGHPVSTPSDFLLLAGRIESRTGEHISDSTVKRLFKPGLSYKTVSDRSLNVIAQYAGYPHFAAFCEQLASRGVVESSMTLLPGGIYSADLIPGARVCIAWQPDRECLLRYDGADRYTVLESVNAKIHPGDSFRCASFLKGRPLYVDNLLQGDVLIPSYGMGTAHGLTRADVLTDSGLVAQEPVSGAPRQ